MPSSNPLSLLINYEAMVNWRTLRGHEVFRVFSKERELRIMLLIRDDIDIILV